MQEFSTASVVTDFLCYRVQVSASGIDVDDVESDEGIGMDQPPHENIPKELHEAIIYLTDELTRRYRDSFERMSEQLEITGDTLGQTLSAVTNEIFADGVISLGRIVAFLAFGGAMCEWCLEKNIPRPVRTVEVLMTAYIDTHLRQWMAENGGWDSLVELHQQRSLNPVSSNSNGTWTGKQLAGVATLGILTVGAFFFRS